MECRAVEGQSDKFCFQERIRKQGEQCTPLDQACVSPLLCLRVNDTDNEGRCVQTCTQIGTTNDCPADHVCEPAETTGVCLPFGAGTKDQECHIIKTRCQQGLACVEIKSTSSSRCKPRCQPKAMPTGCGPNEKCFTIDTQEKTGACVVPTIRKEGESCAFVEQQCAVDLACVKLNGQTTPSCHLPCTSNGDCTNPQYPDCSPGPNSQDYCQP